MPARTHARSHAHTRQTAGSNKPFCPSWTEAKAEVGLTTYTMCKYFHLSDSLGSSTNSYAKEVLLSVAFVFCFASNLSWSRRRHVGSVFNNKDWRPLWLTGLLLPHGIPASFLALLTETVVHDVAAFAVVFSRCSDVGLFTSRTRNRIKKKNCSVYILFLFSIDFFYFLFFIAVPWIGPVILLRFGSPLIEVQRAFFTHSVIPTFIQR